MPPAATSPVTIALTPHGRLVLVGDEGGERLADELDAALREAFARGSGHGLLELGARAVGSTMPAALAFARDLGARYVTALCAHPEPERRGAAPTIAAPGEAELAAIVAAVPPMTGAEYLTTDVVAALWRELDGALAEELAGAGCSVQDFLARRNPAWHLIGRVHFNLAENRADDEAPFAFLATYTAKLSAAARAQHVPLSRALDEYAGAANKPKLLSLLVPVQRAALACAWLRELVDSGDLFHPLRWTPREAAQLLADVGKLEQAGVVVRVPAAWGARRPPRPQVTATVGGKAPSGLAADALLDFRVDVTLDGAPLTADEIERLLAETSGLALLRGRWVEIDGERLRAMVEQMRRAERAARDDGVSFAEAMRLVAGTDVGAGGAAAPAADPDWSRVVAGPWLAETLRGLRAPGQLAAVDPGEDLETTLRPYQEVGVRWLHLVTELGLGACLADDMGLGKTIQVLSLLLVLRRRPGPRRPSLLVAPASLLANWSAEIDRFAPSLRVLVAHPSVMSAAELKEAAAAGGADVDLVITSYGTVARLPWLEQAAWDLVILDEAQAIKNPAAKQTRAVKRLRARARLALTGTPVENRLGDLWSVFDFANPGLLGSPKQFTAFAKRLADRPDGYAPLRALVRPYILRRMKTDRAVIADLPDKTEVNAYCSLSRRQVALYEQAVDELAARLRSSDGIQRRGVVLASLVRMKQICNHPSQWLGDGAWAEADSGKLARLRELGETIASKQDKVLVFTQFRETTAPLAAFLGGVFGRPGLVLHGDTPVKERKELVRRFQDDEAVPFFVLSLKAGGTGLNLTAASHVIHFDRWWNPAVEDQATDRAFRIGQTRNVLVHKFVCRGTVEDKIDQLIASKRALARDLLEGGAEAVLTEMADDELLRLVSLDLARAMEDG